MIPDELIGKKVVLDTDSSYSVVGTLVEKLSDCLVLNEADVHDKSTANTHQDLYLSDVSGNGIQVNRRKVYVMISRVVCLTNLDDVVGY